MYPKKIKNCFKGPSQGGLPIIELRKLAKKMGINTKGMLKADICREIEKKLAVPQSGINLEKLDGISDVVIYNNEPLIFEIEFISEDQSILATLDFKNKKHQEDFMKTCRRNPLNMVRQMWGSKDNKLILENQDNAIRHHYCDDFKHPFAERVFRGASRFLWKLFLEEGLNRGAFSPQTVIELEARGSFQITRLMAETTSADEIKIRKDEAYWEDHERIWLEQQLALVKFYERLGFVITGPGYFGKPYKYPIMESTVEQVLENI